jgi:hypothetical protein
LNALRRERSTGLVTLAELRCPPGPSFEAGNIWIIATPLSSLTHEKGMKDSVPIKL